MKQTKSAKFRELYFKIEELLKLYTYEGVIEILKNDYELDLSEKTFTLYLYRARKAINDKSLSARITSPNQLTLDSVAKISVPTPVEKLTDQIPKLPSSNSESLNEDEKVSDEVINEMLAELNTEKKNLQKKTIFNKQNKD